MSAARRHTDNGAHLHGAGGRRDHSLLLCQAAALYRSETLAAPAASRVGLLPETGEAGEVKTCDVGGELGARRTYPELKETNHVKPDAFNCSRRDLHSGDHSAADSPLQPAGGAWPCLPIWQHARGAHPAMNEFIRNIKRIIPGDTTDSTLWMGIGIIVAALVTAGLLLLL